MRRFLITLLIKLIVTTILTAFSVIFCIGLAYIIKQNDESIFISFSLSLIAIIEIIIYAIVSKYFDK